MSDSNELTASLARLEEWARHSEALAKSAERDRAEMIKQLNDLSTLQSQLIRDMAVVKPVTDMVTSVRYKVGGAAVAFGVLGTIIWAGITFFKDFILHNVLG